MSGYAAHLAVGGASDDDGEARGGKRPRLEHVAAVPRVIGQPLLPCRAEMASALSPSQDWPLVFIFRSSRSMCGLAADQRYGR